MSEESLITQGQFEALKRQIDDIAKTIDIRFDEWAGDRKDITDILVRLKTVEAKLDGTRDDIADGNKKIINRVDEHLEPIPQMMGNAVKTELNKKSMIEKLKEAVRK